MSDRNIPDAMEAMHTIWSLAPKYAQAKGERVYIERFRDSLKALLMKDSSETSAAAQERDAYAHPRYQELLNGLKEAVIAEETLKWKLVSAEAAIEIFRTMEASNRRIDRATQ